MPSFASEFFPSLFCLWGSLVLLGFHNLFKYSFLLLSEIHHFFVLLRWTFSVSSLVLTNGHFGDVYIHAYLLGILSRNEMLGPRGMQIVGIFWKFSFLLKIYQILSTCSDMMSIFLQPFFLQEIPWVIVHIPTFLHILYYPELFSYFMPINPVFPINAKRTVTWQQIDAPQ